MVTFIYITCEVLTYIAILYVFNKFLLRSKKILFAVVSFLFVATLWLNAEFFNKINIFLRRKEVFLEIGHASILNLQILFLMCVLSLIIIIKNALKK